MTSIIYVGMDVHTTNYTLCCYSMEDDRFFAEVQVEPDAKNILKYLARIEKQQSRDCRIVCGYEAGCLGYSLYHQLHAHGIDCVILSVKHLWCSWSRSARLTSAELIIT